MNVCAKYAFEYAYLNNRKKVTAVHKANIMKLADGLFLESCREISTQYPATVTPNLYGNPVANVAAGIVGGTGVIPGGISPLPFLSSPLFDKVNMLL